MRRLSPDEEALWARVMATVRPLDPTRPRPSLPEAPSRPAGARPKAPGPVAPASPARRAAPGTTLDAGWDRRLARGAVAPDAMVDLHGHNLSEA